MAEEDSIDENNNNENENKIENSELKDLELNDFENTDGDFESDGSIFDLMTRLGFFFIAHSTFQLNSALKESPVEMKHKTRIVVLEFVARWCGLCRFIEPQFEVKSIFNLINYNYFRKSSTIE